MSRAPWIKGLSRKEGFCTVLRPTAARAFAVGRDRPLRAADPAEPRDRLAAVARLFTALYRGLGRQVDARLDVLAREWEARRRRAEKGTARASRLSRPLDETPLRVGKKRALLDGSEFVLETPRASYRFLDSLDGLIRVFEIKGDKLVNRELISVQHSADGYRPIRKLLGKRREAFQFTSVKALIDTYLGCRKSRREHGASAGRS